MRVLGRTGVQVSELCLGAMVFGAWGNRDHDECVRIIGIALDNGINFVDTADVYADGESEEIVGRALKGRRDDVVLATKGHGQMGSDPNEKGNSRRWITRAVDASLRRLDTDWIDLYQIHRPDPTCDIEETLSVLTDLVRAGKIRSFGSSTFPSADTCSLTKSSVTCEAIRSGSPDANAARYDETMSRGVTRVRACPPCYARLRGPCRRRPDCGRSR